MSPLFTTVIPSKIFENAAMEIPILMGVEGEAKDIIESYHAGVCFEPENQKDFIDKLSVILSPDKRPAFETGCYRLAEAYDRKKLASDMLKIIIDSLNSNKVCANNSSI